MIDRPDGSPDEPRQRWRIVFARDAAVRDAASGSGAAWEDALAPTGLPIARSLGKSPRPKLTIGAPLPAGMAGEAELADLVLTERLPVADVRARLLGHLPEGHRLVDVHDVWLGAPSVITQIAAADYRVAIAGASAAELDGACAALIAANAIDRSRQKGDGRAVTYDLRPLILILTAAPSDAPSDGESSGVTLRMRLRHAQDGPSGRPDEVILTLGEALGRPLEVGSIVRERLLTADMLEGGDARSG